MLFQRFAERKTLLEDFLDSFLKLRKLQHINMFLVKKLQEMIEFKSTQRRGEILPDTLHFSAEQLHNSCLPACGLTTSVALPTCCYPSFLLPCGTHMNTAHCLQHVPLCHDYNKSIRPGVHGRGPKWPARPVRLQPLVQQRRHQQAPQ